MYRSKTALACLACGAIGAAALAPAASAKTEKVKIKCQTKQTGTALSGTCTGKPFGKAKVGGTIVIPNVSLIVKAKGGTATLKYTGKLNGTTITANWKWSKGTGKFKRIKGSGKARGSLNGDFTFTGKATY